MASFLYSDFQREHIPHLLLYLPVSIFNKYKNVSLYLLKRPQTEVSVMVDSYLWWGQKGLFVWRVVNLSERKMKLKEEVKIAQDGVEVRRKLMVETKVTSPTAEDHFDGVEFHHQTLVRTPAPSGSLLGCEKPWEEPRVSPEMFLLHSGAKEPLQV